MRLIHHVIEEAATQPDEEITPLGAALEALLGGQRGSLPELADRFTAAGLGYVMASWISRGPNLPIAPEDLGRILGHERVKDLATLTGLKAREFLKRLSRALPEAVHRMTPEGRPEPGPEPRDT
ncbi:MAG TPA: YidB family protein [Acetobacteraceae bacterium]|nr:YidB family protein [Acetobacteraceae bacterium]